MKRMNVVMNCDRGDNTAVATTMTTTTSGSGKYECDSCRVEFPNKTSADRHALFCRTLAEIRRGGGGGAAGVSTTIHNGATSEDALMPTQREMFILIQELAAKYNKVKDELDVMKQWAKMVGRRIGGAGGGGGGGGTGAGAGAGGAGVLEFTSITRQKRQNMEAALNEEDDEMIASAAAVGAENPVQLRPSFTEWLSSSGSIMSLGETDLNVVFYEDLVAGITAALLRILAEYTAESGKSHLVPFKLADVKQGAFYIYDVPFQVGGGGPDLPVAAVTTRRWRAIEPCEFQLLVNTIHKLLFKEFKKWQDRNWEAQHQMTKQRQKAASSYHQVMSSIQGSPAALSCDGMYSMPGGGPADDDETEEPVTDTVLSEDFATLYNKYADKMLGGALSNDTILTRVRAKLWKDMKAWRL
jgi:hypothetical protein